MINFYDRMVRRKCVAFQRNVDSKIRRRQFCRRNSEQDFTLPELPSPSQVSAPVSAAACLACFTVILIFHPTRRIYFPLQISFKTNIHSFLSKVRSQKKITGLFGNFSHIGGGLPNSQNFCKLTKYFFVCQIHSEVLKYVLQRGGW